MYISLPLTFTKFFMKKRLSYILVFIFSLGLSFTAQAKQTFTIFQSKPEIQHIDLGSPGMSLGDILAFEAPFTTKDGEKGKMLGMVTIVSLPTGPNDPFLDRIISAVLDFGENNTLIVGGKSVYNSYQSEIKDNAPQIRAVIGGTGRFIGARGQITTSRSPSGNYEHVIQLLD